ncbi:MAG: ABC transporter permease [Chitinophagaceae bacterium]|jgi:ABC-type transport system involved in multi-copper enzyme maturation permease subunit|nr:ABC transporter permease [Chitinophagaceae bacterium]
MLNLLRTEWLKIRKYWAFWGVMALTALSYPGINYLFYKEYLELTKKGSSTGDMAKMLMGNPFVFPENFHTIAFFSSVFVFIPAIVVIMLVTNEYTYKTNRQNIIDGWSRNQFLLGKFIDVALISVLVTLIYFIVALAIGFLSSKPENRDIWAKSNYIGLFALQTFSQLSIAFLVGFLVRKSFIALSVFVFYFLIVENLAVGFLKAKSHDEGRFLPLEISDRLIPLPAFMGRFNAENYKASLAAIGPHIGYTILVTALVWGICYWTNRKRDL